MWIHRDISAQLALPTGPIQVLRGPRQCGKTSLLLHLGPEFTEVSLDDPALRALAQQDPELFLKQFGTKKIFIDEAQYAPNLFPSLKRKADQSKRNTASAEAIIRITGSNQILLDRQVKESLAGRASFFDLNTLTVAEIMQAQLPFSIQDILYQGGFPEIYRLPQLNAKKYLDDYINSYIEKDIVLTAGIQKAREFLAFVRLLAGRVGSLLDLTNLAQEVGTSAKTIKEWASVLERMQIIALVPPYYSNLSKRLSKSPKIFFLDNGLACRLQGWHDARPILTSPQQGPLFENLVFSELAKMIQNFQLGWHLYHWRSRDGEEIDFLLEVDPQHFIFIEAKVSPQKIPNLQHFREIQKVFAQKKITYWQCHQEGERVLGQRIPLAQLQATLVQIKNSIANLYDTY